MGIAVAISGNTILLGAPDNDGLWANAGSLYIFRKIETTWLEEANVLASDGFVEDDFGSAVAIHNDLVAVGAPANDDAGSSSGSTYVMRALRVRDFAQ